MYLRSKREYVVICTIRYEFRSPSPVLEEETAHEDQISFFFKNDIADNLDV